MVDHLSINLKMQFRVPISIFFSFAFPIVMMTIMVISYGNFSIGGSFHFIDKYFLISTSIGLIPMAFISFPIALSTGFESNNIIRLKYLGINIQKMIMSQIIVECLLSLFSILLNIFVAKIFFNLHLPHITNFFAFIVQILYAVIGMIAIGALLALVIRKSRTVFPVGMILLFITYMLIGVFTQYGQLPEKVKKVASYLPIKYVANDFFTIWNDTTLWNVRFLILNTIFCVTVFLLIFIIYKFTNTKKGF